MDRSLVLRVQFEPNPLLRVLRLRQGLVGVLDPKDRTNRSWR